MSKTTRKITVSVILVFVLLMTVVFAAVSYLDLYPDAEFVFSGMSMQNGANGKVQGFVNMNLKGVDATSVSFTIKYDERYIVPSDHETNEPTEDFGSFYVQNMDNFPEGSLSTDSSYIDKASGNFSMFVKPSIEISQEDAGDNIGFSPDYEEVEDRYRYIKATVAGGLDLGKLSFQIVDPAGVSQMTAAELNKIFYVQEDDGEDSMEISYYDSTGNEFCTETITPVWDIKIELIEVQPISSEISVLAPDIYSGGKVQDLIDYLNQNHRRVQLRWSDEDITLDNITWDITKCTVTDDPYDSSSIVTDETYSPKGGTYIVTQQYNEKFEISVKVNVESVNLLGFTVDNETITYASGTKLTKWEELLIPEKATLVMDKVVNRFAPYEELVTEKWSPNTIPQGIIDSDAGTYEFNYTILPSDIDVPWLTIDEQAVDWDVEVYRIIGEDNKTHAPLTIEASVAKDTGVLTITVKSLADGSETGSAIESGTTFRVKFPNGYILDSKNSIMTETVNTDGTATIVIKTTDLTDLTQNSIQSMINLGSSKFALSATAPNKEESDFTGFTSPRRENFYTQNEYVDYSGGKRHLFTVSADMELDKITKHVNLVDSSVIHIAYDGMTGQQPATMKEVHVDGWTIKDDPSATNLPSTPGTTVTLVGTMTHEYFYTNHGVITNTDGYVFELTVTTSEKVLDPPEEDIKVTTNETDVYEQVVDSGRPFYYDTKREGYDSAQIQTFTIHNLGEKDIEGLNIHIDSTDFILVSAPDPSIEKGTGKTTFRISTKTGLSARKDAYTANVTISSNDNTALETFEIIFKVTNNQLYLVTVKENNSSLGDGRVLGSAWYEAGESVTILATPATDCEFKGWVLTDEKLTLFDENGDPIDLTNNPNPTFVMPAQNVEITAVFEETIEGKLRLGDLRVKNPDNSDNVLKDAANTVISFSPDVYEYYVTVPYGTDQNKIWVKPRYAEIDGTKIVPIIDKAGTNIPCAYDKADLYYKTDLFDLDVGQNVYTITQQLGEYSKTYTVIIVRKSVSVTLPNGNSPFGLIEADATAGFDKQQAKDYFSLNYCYEDGKAPAGAANTKAEKYYPDAWGTGENLDTNPTALFVYSGKSFVDPGFRELKDGADAAVDPSTVKRTIKAVKLTNLTEPDAVTKLNSVEEVVVTLYGGESCVIDIAKDNTLRPGIYEIVYSFTDYDGSENTFSRPLVLLYDKGDTDVTDAVDNADYTNIYNRMTNGITAELINNPADWCGVYAYRICDVNSDRNVNSIDANNINSKIKEGGGDTASFAKFYEVLPESLQ